MLTPSHDAELAVVACTDLACMQANDGRIVDLAGVFELPTKKAFASLRVRLRDGSAVLLVVKDKPLRARLAAAPDGARVVIRGRIFTGEIPERYGIIGRAAAPYLLEVSAVAVVDQ